MDSSGILYINITVEINPIYMMSFLNYTMSSKKGIWKWKVLFHLGIHMKCAMSIYISLLSDHTVSDFLFFSYISFLHNIFTILFPTYLYKKCLFEKNPYYIIKQRLIVFIFKVIVFICL